MRRLLILLFLSITLQAATFQMPTSTFKCSGGVTDMVIDKNKLYVATKEGAVDVFDLIEHKKLYSIKLDSIKDFMGNSTPSKIYSVDVLNKKVLLLSQAPHGFRRVHLYSAGKLQKVISSSDQLYLGEAKFIDKNTLLLATLGSELISYDTKEAAKNYMIQVSQSKFSNFQLSLDKTEVAVVDESGVTTIHKTKDGHLLQSIENQNLDNVFQVDFKGSKVATAGQDRRVVIYDTKTKKAYYKSSKFLIYAVGLSPSGKRVAYASDEQNNVTVFDTDTKKTVGQFGAVKMTLSKIVFIDEEHFLVASDDDIINLYQIK